MSLDVSLVCECDAGNVPFTIELYTANITHNLTEMAEKAGLYKYLWRPDELSLTKAKELIKPLTQGLQKLKSNSDYYKEFSPSNGWGTYEGLVKFTEDYLEACKKYPKAYIEISR